MAQAQVKEREDKEDKELKPGERAPQGPDGPKVQYAAGKVFEMLLGLHPEDRKHVAEWLNKAELLSGGVSKVEKDQAEDAKKAKEASDKWVKEAPKFNKKVAEEAAKAAQEKHDVEVDKSKGKAK